MKRDDSLTPEETSQLLYILEKDVYTCDITPRSDKPSKHGAPEYLVLPIATRELTERFGTGKIALADLGLSYLTSDPNKRQKYPSCHASPGLMINNLTGGPPDDVWSLACTIYQLLTSRTLFHANEEYIYRIEKLEWLFGPLPAIYRRKAKQLFAVAEKPDEKPERPETPEDPSSVTEPVSKFHMKDYDECVNDRQQRYLFFKDWSQPLQVLLREPMWQKEEGNAMEQLDALHKHEEATEKTDATETDTDSQYVEAGIPPIDERKPRGPKSEEQIQIRQQYDLIDQCNLPKGVMAYSIKRVDILVIADLLLQMFQLDPEKRINIDKVLGHPWFDEIKTDPAVWL